MADVDCPYFDREYKKCAFFGTYQDGYQKESVCQSSSNWKSCPNYTGRSYEEKVTKKIRSNPDI
jgi:hypothetical protein